MKEYPNIDSFTRKYGEESLRYMYDLTDIYRYIFEKFLKIENESSYTWLYDIIKIEDLDEMINSLFGLSITLIGDNYAILTDFEGNFIEIY